MLKSAFFLDLPEWFATFPWSSDPGKVCISLVNLHKGLLCSPMFSDMGFVNIPLALSTHVETCTSAVECVKIPCAELNFLCKKRASFKTNRCVFSQFSHTFIWVSASEEGSINGIIHKPRDYLWFTYCHSQLIVVFPTSPICANPSGKLLKFQELKQG